MESQATGLQSELQAPAQLRFTAPRSNELFVLPLIHRQGDPSVPAEVMAGIWQQICNEGKAQDLFYDGSVKDLKDWITYIYNPNNHVALVIDDSGHCFHIAWINKFYQGHGFLHHCGLGRFNRRSWGVLLKFWRSMLDNDGKPIIYTLLGITPITNERACKLTRMLGWTILGNLPGVCYLANEKRRVAGMVSYYVINEV